MLQKILGWLTFRKALLMFFGSGAGVLVVALASYQVVVSTESSAFCGQVCHKPMYPEYTTYQASPHSTVACSSCHVGAGTYNLVTSKLSGLLQISAAILDTYERPIPSPVENLRPARETCEQCHTPQKFSGDIVRTRSVYQSDEANTKKTNTVVLKVGGGASDVSKGIHWHIVSELWYLPMDEERLEVGWVGVERDGVYKEYVNPTSAANITAERIAGGKRLMDCVDCHNRASHIFRSPDELVDRALQDRSIDDSLPFVKREAMRAIGTPSPSLKEAYARAESLEGFYKDNYPSLYAEKKGNITRAVDKLKEIARLTTFPEMLVDWNTHADHSGHNRPPDELMVESKVDFADWQSNKSAGCFRCHGTLAPVEGSLISNGTSSGTRLSGVRPTSSPQSTKPLDASCNLCHYTLSQASSPIPSSLPHPTEGLADCLLCHGKSSVKPVPEDHPWSTNEACTTCHQTGPTRSVPQIKAQAGSARNTPHPTQRLEDCLLCHDRSAPQPFGSDHVWSTNETCSACHGTDTAPLPPPSARPVASSTPRLTHPTRGLENCLLCHDKSAPKPFGANHPWGTDETCSACHKTAPAPLPLPAPAPVTSAPQVPHLTRGLENCLLCHGKSAAKPFGNDHPWSTNETCRTCHTTATTIIPFPQSSSGQSPLIPHTTTGLSECRLCHSQSGARPFPADHAAIPSTFCTLCHQAAPISLPPSIPVSAPAIPHSLEGRQDCLSCHGLSGFEPALPSDHAGRTNSMCTSCHSTLSN